jgi:hypothetical protein
VSVGGQLLRAVVLLLCVQAFFSFPMELAVIVWIVRGANNPAKRRAMQLFFSGKHCNIVCLQETKIEVLNRTLVVEMLGPKFRDSFIYLPTTGVRGGVLLACTNDFQIAADPATVGSQFSITGTVVNIADNSSWSLWATGT